MKKIVNFINIALLFALANAVYAYQYDQLPEVKQVNIDQSITTKQVDKMILAAKRYAAFWNTGEEKFAKQALADSFIDLNLPKGRKQGKPSRCQLLFILPFLMVYISTALKLIACP
jgi:hypothetical protein